MIAKLILLGTLCVTSYRPTPAQTKPECTNRDHCRTSIDDGITKYGAAISQDFLKSGELHYGDTIYIEGYGTRVLNDCMALRKIHSVDLLVLTHAEEKAVGVRHLRVWKIDVSQK